jgi:hypothetical protein
MIHLLIVIAILVIGFFLARSYNYDALGILVVAIGLIGVCVLGIAKGMSPYKYNVTLIKRNVLQEQLDICNERDKLMDATLTLQIVEVNMSIDREKYYNTTSWGWYVDDRFMELEPIKID